MSDLAAQTRYDQRCRWESGHKVLIESYFDQYPSLRDSEELVLDLIYSEVLLREEFGDVVVDEEYYRRFPQYALRLTRQFELHRLIKSGVFAPVGETTTGRVRKLPEIPGYVFIRELGAGTWGTVYEALQLSLNRRVAIKMLHSDARPLSNEVLRREAEAVAQLQHPNIAQVYELADYDGRLFLVMELVDGGSLAAALTTRVICSPLEAARIAAIVARAVHHAHEQSLIHRDLKPANILIKPDSTVKITDFGLAKRLDSTTSLAESGTPIGTACYMSPEQARGDRKAVGPEADVYAIGAILHELLTGKPPFQGKTFMEVLDKICRDEPPRISRQIVPRDLDAIRLKCLEKSRARRYATAQNLADDLERWSRGEPVVARPPSRLRRMGRFVRRRKLLITGLAVLLLGAGFGGGIPVYHWYTDPLNRMQRALRRGEAITLVGETGLPNWYRWHIGRADLDLLDDGSQAASFRTTQLSFLELCPDPMVDHYRFSVELRHLESIEKDGIVGIFVGYETQSTPESLPLDRCYGVEYSDYLIRNQTKLDTRFVRGMDNAMIAQSDGRCVPSRPAVWAMRYPASDTNKQLPPWRTLRLEVTPNEVFSEWSVSSEAPKPLRNFLAAADYERRMSEHQKYFLTRSLSLQIPHTGWSTRRGLGIYAERSQLAFRRVVIEPIH